MTVCFFFFAIPAQSFSVLCMSRVKLTDRLVGVCLSVQLRLYAVVCLRTCYTACLSVCPGMMFTSVSFAEMIAFSNSCKSGSGLTHSLLFLLSCCPTEASQRRLLTFTGTFIVALQSLQARCCIRLVLSDVCVWVCLWSYRLFDDFRAQGSWRWSDQ